jgi:hypothetical protein
MLNNEINIPFIKSLLALHETFVLINICSSQLTKKQTSCIIPEILLFKQMLNRDPARFQYLSEDTGIQYGKDGPI